MNPMNTLAAGALALATTLGMTGCATHRSDAASDTARVAIARLKPTRGHAVRGTVTFQEETQGVRVTANITGLTQGPHGFHVHQNGDCSAPDAMSAGDHFNPTGAPHGGPRDARRHIGDMGNVVADDQGVVRMQYVDQHLTLDGPNSIIGRAVIVHAGGDDLMSQPSGDAGARVACGVIEWQSNPGAP